MSRKDDSYICLSFATGELCCYHCGQTYDYNRALPAPIGIAQAICNAFKKLHKRCTQNPAGVELNERHAELWKRQQEQKKVEDDPT